LKRKRIREVLHSQVIFLLRLYPIGNFYENTVYLVTVLNNARYCYFDERVEGLFNHLETRPFV